MNPDRVLADALRVAEEMRAIRRVGAHEGMLLARAFVELDARIRDGGALPAAWAVQR